MKDGYLFVHGTTQKNLSAILKCGYIDPNPKRKHRIFDYNWNNEDDYNWIWIQILDAAPKKCDRPLFWGFGENVVMIFNENILRFQKGRYGGFGHDTILKGAFDSTIDKKYSWLGEYTKSIIQWMKTKESDKIFDRIKNCGLKFMHSHEIKLKKRVTIVDSLIGIAFHDCKNLPKFRKMLDDAGLHKCKVLNGYTSYEDIKRKILSDK